MFKRFLLAICASTICLGAQAYETVEKLYYSYVADGICYSITDDDEHTVKVSGTSIRDEYAFDPSKIFRLHVPSRVTIKDVEYRVTAIGNNAFRNCLNLDSVIVDTSVTFIGSSAFADCPKLKTILLPNSVTEIDDHAFAGTPIDTIVLPRELQFLGIYAFEGCQNLKHIYLPKNVAEFGPTIFRNCSNLVSISVSDSSKTMCSMDGVLYDKKQMTLIACPEGRTAALIIPSTVAFVKTYFPTNCKLSCVSCTSPTPPYVLDKEKESIPVSLFVPKRSVDAYQQHAFWSRFVIHPF